MDGLTEDEAAIVALVREFVDREVRPVARELDHTNTYPGTLILDPPVNVVVARVVCQQVPSDLGK